MKQFKKSYLWATAIACSLLFTQCKDDDGFPDGPFNEDNTVETIIPTEDLRTVTSDLSTYVYQGNFTSIQNAVISRFTNKVGSCDVSTQVVIMDGATAGQLSDEDAVKILKAYINKAAVIIAEPTEVQWDEFAHSLVDAAKFLDESDYHDTNNFENAYITISTLFNQKHLIGDVYDFEGNEKTPFHAVGICGIDVVHLDKVNPKNIELNLVTVDSLGNEESEIISPKEIIFTPYDEGLQADMFVDWVNRKVKNLEQQDENDMIETLTRASNNSLQDIVNAQSDTEITYLKSFPGHGCNVTIDRRVWSCYNFTEDADYYMVNQKIYVRASQLNCGPDDDKGKWRFITENFSSDWFNSTSEKIYYYGPYISTINARNLMCDGWSFPAVPLAGVEVLDWSPQNGRGDVQSPVSLNVKINANQAMSMLTSKPSVSKLGSLLDVSLEGSWGITVKDFDTEVTTSDGVAVWKLSSPTVKYASLPTLAGFEYNHGIAANSQKSDQTYSQSWIMRIKNPTELQYALAQEVNVTSNSIIYRSILTSSNDGQFLSGRASYYSYNFMINKVMNIIAPPRARQHWEVYCEVVENNSEYNNTEMDRFIEEDLQRRFESYGYGLMVIDANKADDYSKAEYCWDEFLRAINNNVSYFQAKHLYGKYKFYLKKKDSVEPYKTAYFNVPKNN